MRAVLTRGLALLALAASLAHAGPWTPYGVANGGRFVSTHPTLGGYAMIAAPLEERSTFVTPDSGAHWTGNPWPVGTAGRPWLSGTVAWMSTGTQLLRSYDQGRSWAVIRGLWSIAGVNPANADEIVEAHQSYVLHSTDAGATWVWYYGTLQIDQAAIDWSTRTLYAVSEGSAILRRSVDSAGDWQSTPANAERVAAGKGIVLYSSPGGALFRSTNQGATFTPVAQARGADPRFYDFAFAASSPRLYALDGIGVMRSDDGGATWTPGAAVTGVDSSSANIAVDAATPDLVYVTSSRGVLASVDGGATFAQLDRASGAPGRSRSVAFDAADPMRQWLVLPYLDVGDALLERSVDGGATWATLDTPFVFPLASSRQRPNTLFGWSGLFAVSSDGGGTWSTTFSPSALNFAAFAQGGTPGVLVLAGNESGTPRLYVSVNDGQSFSERASPPIGVLAMAVAPSSSATIYAGGIDYDGDILWRSTDGAASWQPIGRFPPKILGWQANQVYALAVDPRDPARVYVGLVYPDNLMRSDDAGATWTRVTKGLGAGAVTSIAIDPANPDTLYAAVYLSGVFRSTDRGATWTALDAGLRDDAVRQVALDPFRPGRVYAATNSGIYKVDLGSELPAGRRRAVEFYHAAFNHYFVSADLDEIIGLDDGVFQGWQRTNYGMRVAEPQSPGNLPTCRFFGVGFGALSSHFYTPYPAECEGLKTNPAWLYEKIAFGLALPNPTHHGCAPDTRPLFRAWNRNSGGAPNHRYTTNPLLLDAMIEFGWIFEGDLPTRVFACVPVE